MRSLSRCAWRSSELEFLPSALKEWLKLGHTVREQIKEKLRDPKVQADALRGMPGQCKIKPRVSGCLLVCRVEDERVVVVLVAVGKRKRETAYQSAKGR